MQTNFKLLIVEDEAIIAENLKITLEELGYEISNVCYNLTQAKMAIEKKDFDLALLDINLKNNESGFDAAKILLENNLPFVFLTAYSDVVTVKEATAYKPAAYLVKPATSGALFAAIQTALFNFEEKKLPSENNNQDYFFVKIGNKTKRISWKDVVLIRSEKNYVALLTADNISSGYLIRSTLHQAINQLMPQPFRNYFVQISRSEYLRLSSITSIQKNILETSFGEFELSDNFKNGLKDIIIIHK
jgi:DNA-binding LytR/AlgR family response regulator